MKIPENIVDQILNAAKIEDVIRSYGVDLRRAGSVLNACCPFHDEKTPSFVVSPGKGIFKCFGCGKGGNVTSFVMEKESCSYPEALRILAKRYNIEVPERELTAEEKKQQSERQNMFALNEWYAKWLTEMMMTDEEGRAIGLSYFRSRAFTDESIKVFQLGYSLPKGNAATEAARRAGFSEELLLQSGITGKNEQGKLYDRFRGRVMFPIHNVTGKIVAFGGRILEKKENTGKYVNTPENVVYHKSNELYGLFQAKNDIVKKNQSILVEGYADVISMHQAGVRNTVASCGTSLTKEQVKAITKYTQNILIIYDGDHAGVKAALRAIDMTLDAGMTVKLVLLPNDSDPDDFAKSHQTDEILEYLEKESMDFVDYQIKALLDGKMDDTAKVNDALTQILKSTTRIKDDMSREIFVKKISKIFDIDRKVIVGKMQSLLRDILDEEERARQMENSQRRQTGATGGYGNGRQEIDEDPFPGQPIPEDAWQNWNSGLVVPKTEKTRELWLREKELVQFILRNVEESVTVNVEGEDEPMQIKITDYLLANMQDLRKEDNSIFDNEQYQRVLDLLQMTEEPTEKMFTLSEDSVISNLAATLLLDPYSVSKRFAKKDVIKVTENSSQFAVRMKEDQKRQEKEEHDSKLLKDAFILLTEYKATVLKEKIKELKEKLKQTGDNVEESFELLREIQGNTILLQKLTDPNSYKEDGKRTD